MNPPPALGRDESTSGLVCRHCGCRHLPVYYTRRQNGRIIRVRECRHCGRRLVTWEAEA